MKHLEHLRPLELSLIDKEFARYHLISYVVIIKTKQPIC